MATLSGRRFVCLFCVLALVAWVVHTVPARKPADGTLISQGSSLGLTRKFDSATLVSHKGTNVSSFARQRESSAIRQSPIGMNSPENLIRDLADLLAHDDPDSLIEAEDLLVRLHAMGLDGLIAVHQFLLQGGEAAALASGITAESELRGLLLDFLLGSRTEGAEALAVELLDSPMAPGEIATIGILLEERAPGLYSANISQAAERAVLNAPLDGELPGTLFEILGRTGDYESIAILEQMPMYRDAYVSVALALLPDGSGIAALEQDARLIESGQHTAHGRLALQLLAQQAAQHPDAARVLADLASKNLVPADLWRSIASLASGASAITTIRPSIQPFHTMTIFWPQGDQRLYTVPAAFETVVSDDLDQRLALIAALREYAPPDVQQYLITIRQQLLDRSKQFSWFFNTTNPTRKAGALVVRYYLEGGEISHENSRPESFGLHKDRVPVSTVG